MLRLRLSDSKVKHKVALNACGKFGFCPYNSCRYAFFSQADMDRHFKLMGHSGKCKPKKKTPKRKTKKGANTTTKKKRKN